MQKYFFDFIFLDILRAGWKSRLGRSFTARLIYGTGLAGVRLARRRHGGGGGVVRGAGCRAWADWRGRYSTPKAGLRHPFRCYSSLLRDDKYTHF